jgi:hypothetical protein
VLDDPPPVSFLCQKCLPLFDIVWDHSFLINEGSLTLNMNDYSPMLQKIMGGLGMVSVTLGHLESNNFYSKEIKFESTDSN